jgi:hypothetical protein
MTKLKTLLEGFAWERKADGSLPTLADTTAAHAAKMANEAVGQEEADQRWNTDRIQMAMRKTTLPDDAVLASSLSTPKKATSNFYREKITALEAQRKQLEFDMEQEAEPEGGPIADYYGEALMHIDDQIDSIRKKMSTNESADPVKAEIAKLEKKLADVKHQYYKDSNLSPERAKQLRQQMGDIGRELKRAKRKDRTGSEGYGKPSNPNSKTNEPRWQDSDGDGTWYEPGDDVKENINESFISRLKKNLIGGATRK